MDSKNINYAERSALIFKEGQLEKIWEKGLKTGNSLVMQAGNCAILDQNFGKYPLLSSFRYPITVHFHSKKI